MNHALPRRRAATVALAAGLTAAAAWPLGRPDWAEPFLARPTPSGTYIAANDSWVTVYAEVVFSLRSARSIEERHRLVVENVSRSPQSFVLTLVYDEGQEELTESALYVQRRLWHEVNLDKKALTASVPGAEQVMLATAEKIEPGRRVAFEYAVADRLGFNPWRVAMVPGGFPIAEARYSVDPAAAARGLRLQLVTPDDGPPPPTFTAEGVTAWKVERVPAYTRLTPRALTYQPVETDLWPFFLADARGTPADSYAAYARHYRARWDERVAAIDAGPVKARAEALTEGARGWLERTVRLTRFVQHDIQYDDANNKSTESWLPISTRETLRAMKGDCKSKTMLLEALLAADGTAAVPVLVRSDTRYFHWRDAVGTAFFNHVVLAVGPPAGEPRPPGVLLEGPLAGWVLVDPTVESVDAGEPMPGFEGAPALAMLDDEAPRFTIHTEPKALGLLAIDMRWELTADGTAVVRMKAADNGVSPVLTRLLAAANEEDRRRIVAETLAPQFVGLSIGRCEVRGPATSGCGRATLDLVFTAARAVQELASSLVAEGPVGAAAAVAGLPDGFQPAARPDPGDVVTLAPPWDARRNTSGPPVALDLTVDLVLPPGLAWAPPPSRSETRAWLRFDRRWSRVDERTWSGSLHLETFRGDFPAAERRERLALMDELLTSLYAPQLLSRSQVR